MSRAPRTTKAQKEFIINFLEENQIILGGKINPFELPTINKLWEKMTTDLNLIGPPKSVKSWKDTISEMKTKVKRHAREVKYGHTGTGGGAATKPLTPLTERLLALLSRLTIEGVNLVEAGEENTTTIIEVTHPETPNVASTCVLPKDISMDKLRPSSIGSNAKLICMQHLDVVDTDRDLLETQNVVPTRLTTENILHEATPSTNIRTKSKLGKERRPRKVLNQAGGRVTLALETHDKHLANLANSNYAIARALNKLAGAISAKKQSFHCYKY